MPPLTCPPPEPGCPVYDQRAVYSQEEMLRRAILMERRSAPGLTALIRAEALRPVGEPGEGVHRPIAALPPAAEPLPLPIFDHLKGASR